MVSYPGRRNIFPMNQTVKRNRHREIPAYTIPEACHYLNLAESTVRYWVTGKAGEYRPVIVPASETTPTLLSFLNLVEVHVLGAMTREYKVRLPKIRSAVDFLKRKFRSAHPLISHDFATDGLSLFIEHYGKLINVSEDGQIAIREVLAAALQRIEWDEKGLPIKLFPFTHTDLKESPRIIVIQPGLAFGRPVIAGTGIPTEIIAERYKAGDSVKELAADYGRQQTDIEEAIRCELKAA